ncbi:MAG: TadE/TadG family type IV pilus assembly protein [Novosphingobium sp.]
MVVDMPLIKRGIPRGMAGDSRGATAVEFALLAPVFFTMLFGIWDIGQMVYASAALRGAVEQVARSTTLESGDTTAADNQIKAAISSVLPGVVVITSRLSYNDFTNIGQPEPWNDSNHSGTCDNGEAYTDQNANGRWDSDVGVSGNGNANDIIMYTVYADYSPIFKIPFAPGTWNTRRLSAVTIRKNQPYANQGTYSSAARSCT